jgi:hypothetical protein
MHDSPSLPLGATVADIILTFIQPGTSPSMFQRKSIMPANQSPEPGHWLIAISQAL